MNPPPPLPFGDPTAVNQQNRAAVKKGLFFGCGGCGLLIALAASLVAGIVAIVMFSMHHNEVCEQALAKAQASSEVRNVLGSPLEAGWMVSGNIATSFDTGTADLSIPISGPNGSGTLHAVAKKEGGKWTFSTLIITINGSPRHIDLLKSASLITA